MGTDAISPLRQRMIEDMSARKLNPHTQRSHISGCKRFAAYLKRSPDTATADEIRLFQLHLTETVASICNRNRIMTGLRFLFRVTLRRLDLAAEIYHIKELQKIPLVMSPDEAKRLLAMAGNLKVHVLLALGYGAGLRAGEVVRQRTSSASCRDAGKPTGRIPHLTPLILVRIQVPQPRFLPISPHIFGFGNRWNTRNFRRLALGRVYNTQVIGANPSHVMSNPLTDTLYVALNGEDRGIKQNSMFPMHPWPDADKHDRAPCDLEPDGSRHKRIGFWRYPDSQVGPLPVPQVFLYEVERNKFLVIDGQQRLMSIYYFIKQRFPKKEKRAELRAIFDEHGKLSDAVVHDDAYFENFRLKLSDTSPQHPNRFKRLGYSTLGTYKTQLELRTIRNVIIKQNAPKDDDSSMYEIFNRLNTGGINLKPQEIRTSMYHSSFYEILYRANSMPNWRRILASPEPDLHMKDVEILLRGYAMLIDGQKYAPSMVKFLNQFSRKSKLNTETQNKYLLDLLDSFLERCRDLPEDAFLKNGRFHVALYEAAFAAVCGPAFAKNELLTGGHISAERLNALELDSEFISALTEGTTQTRNVKLRLERANAIFKMGAG